MSATIRDADGNWYYVVDIAHDHSGRGVIVSVEDGTGDPSPLDREGAVSLIEALTAAVEAADAREAAEARKLKRGDKVRIKSAPAHCYTVITDEDHAGRVEVVSWSDGVLWGDQRASIFERIPE